MEQLDFEKKVKEIFYYTSRHGVYTLFNGQTPPENFDRKKLRQLCFDGYKIGQSKIIEELRKLQTTIIQLNIEIKSAKRERNKELEKQLSKQLEILEYQEDIFRNLADTIAWQLLDGQHYFLRRLYTGEEGNKDLLDKSFDVVIDYSEKINANPDSFCLITDITNNIQLGDCLVVDLEAIKVVEIKSGKKNLEAIKIIEENNLTEENFKEEEFKIRFDEKFTKQLKRMLSQTAKTEKAAKIIENNRGEDPKHKNVMVNILENDFEIKTYHSVLIELINKLENSDWAYDCVEAIVHIGVYKNEMRFLGPNLIKNLCNDFPVYDLMSGRGITMCEPIFLKPLLDGTVIDIVLGRIRVFIGIDINKFLEFCIVLGINAKWSTAKELQKYKEMYNSKEIFSYQNKGIKMELNGREVFLGYGFFVKIIYDHMLPSTMILKYQDTQIELGASSKDINDKESTNQF